MMDPVRLFDSLSPKHRLRFCFRNLKFHHVSLLRNTICNKTAQYDLRMCIINIAEPLFWNGLCPPSHTQSWTWRLLHLFSINVQHNIASVTKSLSNVRFHYFLLYSRLHPW